MKLFTLDFFFKISLLTCFEGCCIIISSITRYCSHFLNLILIHFACINSQMKASNVVIKIRSHMHLGVNFLLLSTPCWQAQNKVWPWKLYQQQNIWWQECYPYGHKGILGSCQKWNRKKVLRRRTPQILVTIRRIENKDMTRKEKSGISKWREVQRMVHRKVCKDVHASQTQNLVVCYIT